MTKPVSCDVVVVGAGPAGSRTAASIAAAGWHTVLLDENERPRDDIVCSGIVGAEAVRRFDLPPEAIAATVRAGRFVSPAGVEVEYEPVASPLAFVVDRTLFDAALAERARASGADILRGHAARDVRRTDSCVEVVTRHAGGRGRFRGRALVVATGHQRWLHGPAGLGAAPGYVQGVHVDLPFEELDTAEVFFGRNLTPGYFAWAAPFGPGTARLGLLASSGARRRFDAFVADPRVRSRLPDTIGARDRAPVHPSSRGIVQGVVRPSYADRVLAVGEAAGQVKTTTAGGIYYGLIGAEIAARVLDRALRLDRLDATTLAGYEDEWTAVLGGELEAGLELQRFARDVSDDDVDVVFELLSDGLGQAVRRLVRFDWHGPTLRRLFGDERVRRLVTRRLSRVGVG